MIWYLPHSLGNIIKQRDKKIRDTVSFLQHLIQKDIIHARLRFLMFSASRERVHWERMG